MQFDTFFSICQTEVDGIIPSEKTMWRNFFDQVLLADQLGIGTAWVAETHLSCQIQKRNPGAVIPHFQGEIGLNTDILQLAHIIFSKTKNLNVGSAIRNILCNGGPMAHAEAIRTFLSLHDLNLNENRILDIGFAAGRFPFSNVPYGIKPRNELEELAWPALRGQIFLEAVEIFLRFLRGEIFASKDVKPKILRRENFRTETDWLAVRAKAGGQDEIVIPSWWTFDDVGLVPFEAPLDHLRLTIGAHDALTQDYANKFMPVGVFNLSITPGAQIEETHKRMQKSFNLENGPWTRSHMPRTVLVFIDDTKSKSLARRREDAKANAEKALANYWRAIEGTLDPAKVAQATENALVGPSEDILEQIQKRFHPDDRLMLWFDFNNHDTESVKTSMRQFMENVAPRAKGGLT